MPDLLISITKRKDGSVVTRFQRPDGTTTWQRKEGAIAAFFAAHDLMHYAVETTLGYRRGFYGLVAEGWNLSDFGSPWPRGPLPVDAEPAELIAGLLGIETVNESEWTAQEFNKQNANYFEQHRLKNPPVLTEEELRNIREAARTLQARWMAAPPGETLELKFSIKTPDEK